ncbi:MAG: RNA polymerase sigma factor FliA [Gammaproteobacteria bacterium]|nr:RNA polymerase sigma factor FliA [Gammaproteobacteria bacterium]MCF6363722.1 RNA polymerase sigma factor FliA [Gammaproteobacteria bacterium]
MSGAAMYAEAQAFDQNINDEIAQHAPLVKRIAYHLMSRLPPSVQQDDLIQAGMIGLLESLRNYDASQGASFQTYARIRIRGAMLDEIRKNDWAPRSVHRKARMVAEVVKDIENRTGRDARDQEIAEGLGVSLPEYHRLLQDASGHRVFSYDELNVESQGVPEGLSQRMQGPLEGLQSADFKRSLADAIAGLPERERLVMTLYYDEELNLREIGSILGVSESRICQIHSQAVIRLQSRMNHWTRNDD